MAQIAFSQAMTANQSGLNAASGWQFEYTPVPARVKVLARATTTGVRMTIYAGSDTVQERSSVQGGGTAGTTPSELNTAPVIFFAAANDRLKVIFDEVSGGTPTVDALLVFDPL